MERDTRWRGRDRQDNDDTEKWSCLEPTSLAIDNLRCGRLQVARCVVVVRGLQLAGRGLRLLGGRLLTTRVTTTEASIDVASALVLDDDAILEEAIIIVAHDSIAGANGHIHLVTGEAMAGFGGK